MKKRLINNSLLPDYTLKCITDINTYLIIYTFIHICIQSLIVGYIFNDSIMKYISVVH